MRATPIGSLISPIPDESGYGVLCRTAKLMGFVDIKTLMNYLIPSAINTGYAFSKDIDLTSLVAWSLLTLQYSPIEAVDRFSNLPLYRPFLTKPAVLCSQTSSEWKMNSAHPWWWKPLGMESQKRRYCIRCIREQYDMYGFTTWLRSQNVGKVVACALHEVKLEAISFSRTLVPCIDLSKDVRNYEFKPATAEEVFHAKYVRSLFDANLPWISPKLQLLVIDNLRRSKPDHDDGGGFSLATRLIFSLPSVNIGAILRDMKSFVEDVELFIELHRDAAAKFGGGVETTLRITPGAVLTLITGDS